MSDEITIKVRKAIKESLEKSVPGIMNEAYVAEVKPYKQVSDLVTEKTKTSHHDLYKGYVESLNRVSAELDTVDLGESNPRHSQYRSLKLDETYNLNATWLHELFFANCFDPNSEVYMDSTAFIRLQRDFGAFEDWQKDFIACAMSAGEGWAVCGYNMFLQRFVNTVVSHHSCDVQVGFYPVIVVDVWSHAYYRDYLTDKKSYIIAMMREFNWNVIEERFAKTEQIAGALK